MEAIVFAPLSNKISQDAEKAFKPEAHEWCEANGVRDEVFLFDNTLEFALRQHQIEQHFSRGRAALADVVVFACHGWKFGIQAGYQVAHGKVKFGNVAKLAASLKLACISEPTVLLYCCDTGRDDDADQKDDVQPGPGGEGGFADALRDELRAIGVRATIFAHASEGHCTTNPFIRRFDPAEVAGGQWVIEPHSELWHAWSVALRSTDLRFRFWKLSPAELEAELRGGARVA